MIVNFSTTMNDSNPDVLFTESQRFRQWWVWLLLLGFNCFILYGAFQQLVLKRPLGSRPASSTEWVVSVVITLAVTLLFVVLRLDTQVRKDGVYVRFFPFHRRFRRYPFSNISRAFVRTYSPLAEYGGWGLRLGLMASGKAFNVSGNKGLQLELTDQKKILIGTNKPEELIQTLNQIGHLKP